MMKFLGFTAEASLYKASSNYYDKENRADVAMKSSVRMQQISQPDFSWTSQDTQLCASVEEVCQLPLFYCEISSSGYRCVVTRPYECHWECRPPGYLRANSQLFSNLIYSRGG
jgi:hypothetical protein